MIEGVSLLPHGLGADFLKVTSIPSSAYVTFIGLGQNVKIVVKSICYHNFAVFVV